MRIKIPANSFFRLVSLNSLSVVLKIIMGFVSTKLSSIYLGVNGVNILEFFRNFTSVSDNISQLGLQNGIIKNAAVSENKVTDQKILSTAFTTLLIFSLVVVGNIILFQKTIQEYLFQSNNYEKIIYIYLFAIPLIGLQMICMSFIKGKQFYKTSIVIDFIGYSINIFLSFYLITQHQLIGAMLQIVVSPVILFLFTYFFFFKKFKNYSLFTIKYFDRVIFRSLFSFMLMGAFSSLITPLTFIVIRSLIQENLSTELSGIWSSILRISSFYMMFVSTIITLYFLPNIAKATSVNDIQNIASKYFKQFYLLVLAGLLLCYFLQYYIIRILYTDEFASIENYLYFQLIADAIRLIGVFFGYCILTKQLVKWYVFFELVSIGSYIVFAQFFIHFLQLKGVYIAQLISILIYVIIVCLFYLYYLKDKYYIDYNQK